MKIKIFMACVLAALLISSSLNLYYWLELRTNEKEYISAFTTQVDNTYNSSTNVLGTKGAAQRRHLSKLNNNLIRIDALYTLHPGDEYEEYFKEYQRMVEQYLNNPSLQIEAEQISELNNDLEALKEHYFVDYEIKDMSLQQFNQHLLSVTRD
ncbi:hypothetical protein [Rossellomorea sp. NS-SX7]|uniref:hypothetical protein n=1 Tax=Rossellomorea sp. NS-SX7 TaxID=3463856 RepID=UPI0040589560